MKYVLIALLLILVGCVTQTPVANETNVTNITQNITENVTQNITENITVKEVDPNYSVQLGDTVWIDYTLRVNGEIYDTSNRSLVFGTNKYNPGRDYEPLQFVVEFNKGIIDGVIINTIGMKVNETVRYDVDPARGYGPYDPTKIIVVPRYYNKTLYETIPREYLESQGINITNGTGFESPYGTVFITDFNDENVTLFYILVPGKEFELNGVPQKVASTTNSSATIEFMLQENNSYWLPTPDSGALQLFKIIDRNDDNITLDYNHPLANDTLNFEVTLVKVEPAN